MGSDLYMERQNWRPRPNKVEWTGEDTIKIDRDAFYTGYYTVYEGKVTPEVETLLKGLGVRLPERNPIVTFAEVSAGFRVSARADDITPDLQEKVAYAIARRIKSAHNLLKKDFPDLDIEVV